jgi:putative spermidine/putrescine transport system substrate-binding protein
MRRFDVICTLTCLVVLTNTVASLAGDAELTVASWGGAYEAAQQEAIFKPFSEYSGTELTIAQYGGGIDAIASRAPSEGWDVIDMLESDAIAACEMGLLVPLDHGSVLGASLRDLRKDFSPVRLGDCSVPQNVYAQVIAYDDRAFPGRKPNTIADFFDLTRFPGKRAIQQSPDAILEWALMAEGVPPSQVHDLLSTSRGLKLAFRKLETIRDAIIWWTDTDQPAALLASGEAVMATGYNGRFFSARINDGAPLGIIWDGRLIGIDVWAVAIDSPNRETAMDFLRFVSQASRQGALATRIPYGPARNSALNHVGLHPDSGIAMIDQLPNSPRHATRSLVRDSAWYAHTQTLRQRHFDAWIAGAN